MKITDHSPTTGAAPQLSRDHVAYAVRELGTRLAEYRERAGLTQSQLAARVPYSRSTVANAEVGRDKVRRIFWEAVDRELTANGGLLAAFDNADSLSQLLEAQRRHRLQQQRIVADPPTASETSPTAPGTPTTLRVLISAGSTVTFALQETAGTPLQVEVAIAPEPTSANEGHPGAQVYSLTSRRNQPRPALRRGGGTPAPGATTGLSTSGSTPPA